MQSLLTNINKFSPFSTYIASLKYIIICEMYALLNLYQFWKIFYQELAAKGTYQARIKSMRLRLAELQVEDSQVQKIKIEKLEGNWEDSNGILHYQGLLYIFETIKTKLISRYYNNLLTGYFDIKKT